jgi:hypothetical protein
LSEVEAKAYQDLATAYSTHSMEKLRKVAEQHGQTFIQVGEGAGGKNVGVGGSDARRERRKNWEVKRFNRKVVIGAGALVGCFLQREEVSWIQHNPASRSG